MVVASDPAVEGFFDCGVRCTTSQDVVGVVAFAGPLLFVLLLLGSLAGYLARRIRP